MMMTEINLSRKILFQQLAEIEHCRESYDECFSLAGESDLSLFESWNCVSMVVARAKGYQFKNLILHYIKASIKSKKAGAFIDSHIVEGFYKSKYVDPAPLRDCWFCFSKEELDYVKRWYVEIYFVENPSEAKYKNTIFATFDDINKQRNAMKIRHS